jgi:hypothetical protein
MECRRYCNSTTRDDENPSIDKPTHHVRGCLPRRPTHSLGPGDPHIIRQASNINFPGGILLWRRFLNPVPPLAPIYTNQEPPQPHQPATAALHSHNIYANTRTHLTLPTPLSPRRRGLEDKRSGFRGKTKNIILQTRQDNIWTSRRRASVS